MTKAIYSASSLLRARQLVAQHAHETPVFTSRYINSLAGASLFFKCENFQKGGAFKFRGAIHALLSTPASQLSHGVATHSSGNHAQALALAAGLQNIKAYIVMPSTAPEVKKRAVIDYGGEIIECAPTLQSREETLDDVVKRTSAHVVHPYNDARIIGGQATCAMELLDQTYHLDAIIAPVGGGGLLSGTALACHLFAEGVQVFGAEPTGADDAFRSLKAGHIVPSVQPNTIADGLLTSLGSETFPIIQQMVKDILTTDDADIVGAMRLIYERMKMVVEPSAAVPLAALLKHKAMFEGKKVGVIVSGGNVDIAKLSGLLKK